MLFIMCIFIWNMAPTNLHWYHICGVVMTWYLATRKTLHLLLAMCLGTKSLSPFTIANTLLLLYQFHDLRSCVQLRNSRCTSFPLWFTSPLSNQFSLEATHWTSWFLLIWMHSLRNFKTLQYNGWSLPIWRPICTLNI
jgi:hypothetical protein